MYVKSRPLKANCYSLNQEGWGLGGGGVASPVTAIEIPPRFLWGTRLFVYFFKIDCNCFGNLTFVDYLLVLNFWVRPAWNKACAVTQFPPWLAC